MTTLGRLPVFTTPPKPRLLQPAPLLRRAAPFQRHARSITAAAGNSDSWWLKDKEHWTLVSSEDELQQVVQSAPNLVLVDCFTPWCGPCKLVDPQLCRLAAEDDLRKECTFVRVNTDDMKDWAGSASVKTLPYAVFYRAGESFPEPLLSMQITPQRIKILRDAVNKMAPARGKKFRVDPNGYVMTVEPAASSA
mmetsp:Transcript_7459/g.22050  ORF Transcript_7459/g.22050 Transcript_7459/m.22050 type:complete len:193 (+) Transcript_7459:189-767(+)